MLIQKRKFNSDWTFGVGKKKQFSFGVQSFSEKYIPKFGILWNCRERVCFLSLKGKVKQIF